MGCIAWMGVACRCRPAVIFIAQARPPSYASAPGRHWKRAVRTAVTGTGNSGGAAAMAAPRQGTGVRRVWRCMLTVLLAAAGASAGDGQNGVPLQKHSYYERDVFIPRNGTCLMADQRVIGCVCFPPHRSPLAQPRQASSNPCWPSTCRPLSHVHTRLVDCLRAHGCALIGPAASNRRWPSDICNGHHDVQKVIDLVKRFADLFDGQFEYGHDYTMQQLQQCAAHASPFFCATYFYFQVGATSCCCCHALLFDLPVGFSTRVRRPPEPQNAT